MRVTTDSKKLAELGSGLEASQKKPEIINCKQCGWSGKSQVAQGWSRRGGEPFKPCISPCAMLLPLPSTAHNCLTVKTSPFLSQVWLKVAFRAMFLFQKKHFFITPVPPDLWAFPQASALDTKLLSHSALAPLSQMGHPFSACSWG